jgi:hypothetical protein
MAEKRGERVTNNGERGRDLPAEFFYAQETTWTYMEIRLRIVGTHMLFFSPVFNSSSKFLSGIPPKENTKSPSLDIE